MNKYEVEWWYADSHGKKIIWADEEEDAIRMFWRQFKPLLSMGFKAAKVTVLK